METSIPSHVEHVFPVTVDGMEERQIIIVVNGRMIARVGVMTEKRLVASVRQLFVAEDHRRQGWGTHLLIRCKQLARQAGCAGMNMALAPDNVKLWQDFYGPLGWHVVAVFPEEICLWKPTSLTLEEVALKRTRATRSPKPAAGEESRAVFDHTGEVLYYIATRASAQDCADEAGKPVKWGAETILPTLLASACLAPEPCPTCHGTGRMEDPFGSNGETTACFNCCPL